MKYLYQSNGKYGYIDATNLDEGAKKWGETFLRPEITCHADLIAMIKRSGGYLTIDDDVRRIVCFYGWEDHTGKPDVPQTSKW